MKLFGKIVLILALLSGVAYAKKVMLFNINKYDLKKKDKNGLETFKVGNIIVKTDWKYHEDNDMYYKGSNMYIYRDTFENISILIKKYSSTRGYGFNGKIVFSDDFGEHVSIILHEDELRLTKKKRWNIGVNSTIKYVVGKKEIKVFNGTNNFTSISIEHMGKITSFQYSLEAGNEIYKFLIFGENKETPKKEKKDAK